MILGTEDNVTLDQLIKYASKLLGLFNYQFKDVDFCFQPYTTNTDTLNDKGELSVCGYLWKPSTDTFRIKPPSFTNGKKFRGKINPPTNPDKKSNQIVQPEFVFETLEKWEQFTPEYINGILESVTKSLRVIVSLASTPFDTLGLHTACMSQVRHTVSTCVKLACGIWEEQIPTQLWDFFLEQLIELHKVSLYEFPRFPDKAISKNGTLELLVISDASNSIIVNCYLIYPTSSGNKTASLITHKSYLGAESMSLPRMEL